MNVLDRPVVYGPIDGNAFAIMAAVRRAIRDFYPRDEARVLTAEYLKKATSDDYDHLLAVSFEYADFEL